MKRLIAFLAVPMLLLTACGQGMTMTTGGSTGTYYSLGSVLADYMAESCGIPITVVSSAGSAANLYSIDDGISRLATVQSDVMDYAWRGVKTFAQDGEIRSFRTLAGLYEEPVQIVTLRQDITTVEDLRGRTVSVGAPGSGVYFNAMDILAACGMEEQDIRAEYLSFADSTDAMKDGKIDAAFIVAGVPTPAITDLAATNAVHLVGLKEEHIAALLAASPFYTRTEPDGYGSDPVSTVAVKATMVVAADTDADVVYAMTAGIFDHAHAIAAVHAKGGELSLEQAVSGMTVPFHPGAARYFAEHGLEVMQ